MLHALALAAALPALAAPLSQSDQERARDLLLPRVSDASAIDVSDPYLGAMLPHLRSQSGALRPVSLRGGSGVSLRLPGPWPDSPLSIGYLPAGTFTTGSSKKPRLYVLDANGVPVERAFLLPDGRLVRVPLSSETDSLADGRLRVEAAGGKLFLVDADDSSQRFPVNGQVVAARVDPPPTPTLARAAEEETEDPFAVPASAPRTEPASKPSAPAGFAGTDEILDPPGQRPGLYRRDGDRWTAVGYRFEKDGVNLIFRYGNNPVVNGYQARRPGTLIDPREASRGTYDAGKVYAANGRFIGTLDEYARGRETSIWDSVTRRWSNSYLMARADGTLVDLAGIQHVRRADGVVVSAGSASRVARAVPEPASSTGAAPARRVFYFDPANGRVVNDEGKLMGLARGAPTVEAGRVASDLSLTMSDGGVLAYHGASGRLGDPRAGTEAEIKVGIPPGMHYDYQLEARRTRGPGGAYSQTLGWSATLARGEARGLEVVVSAAGAEVVSAPDSVDGARLRFLPAGDGRFRSENGTVWLLREGNAYEGERWVAKRFVQTPVERRCEACRMVQLHDGRFVDDPAIAVTTASGSPLAGAQPPAGDRRLVFGAGNELALGPAGARGPAKETAELLQTGSSRGDFFYRPIQPLAEQARAAAPLLASLDSPEARRWAFDGLLAAARARQDYAEGVRVLPFTIPELERAVESELR
ncbi:MAG TPA: hypothetical protein VNI01_05760, partial [Elusimicrobiota bacterium]|nr:hypothetical protein [Elusimicrobiota bacterium]